MKSILVIVKTGPSFEHKRVEMPYGIGERVFLPKYGEFDVIDGIYTDGRSIKYLIDGGEYSERELMSVNDLDVCPCCTRRAYRSDYCFECGFDPDEIEPTLSVTERHGVSGFLRPKI